MAARVSSTSVGNIPILNRGGLHHAGFVIQVLETWCATDLGAAERFEGQFTAFFALHEKKKLEWLKNEWASFSFMCKLILKSSPPA